MARRIIVARFGLPTVCYLATDWYASRPSDTPANLWAQARLVSLFYEAGVSFPTWSRSGGAAAISEVEVLNTDGDLDDWLDEDWRDVRIDLFLVESRAAWSTREQVGSVIAERIEASSPSRLRITCRSALERLDRVITSNYSASIPNTQQRGQPKPITLGHVKWCDLKAYRTDGGSAATRAILDVCDGPFESIYQILQRGGTSYTSTPEPGLTSANKWWENHGNDGYGIRGRDSTYRLTAEVYGQTRRGDQLLLNTGFDASWETDWSGIAGDGAVTQPVSGGDIQIDGFGAGNNYVTQSAASTAGQLYEIEVTVTSQTGSANIQSGSIVLRTFEAAGGYKVGVVVAASGSSFVLRVGVFTGQSGTLTISAVQMWPVFRIDDLYEVLRFVAERVGMSFEDIDLDGCEAIQTETDYTVAFHAAGETTGAELARLVCASYGVALVQNTSGLLSPVRLEAPAATASYSIEEWRIKGGVEVEVDLAPGLSTRMTYGRNYAKHSDEDAQSAATADIREALVREVRTVTTTETLDALYDPAIGRDPIETLLELEADAQAEIDRLCGLYTVPRKFWTLVEVDATDITDPLQIQAGDTVHATHSRYGLSAGKNLLVVHRRSGITDGRITLVCWG